MGDIGLVYAVFPDRFHGGAGPAPGGEPWGGTLDGVAARADHIASLGADAVYLTPVHPSPSYHRYDATDFKGVDPRLGGLEAFGRMVAALRARGIRIIVDLVLNHVSDRHPWFQAALADPGSPFRRRFRFREDGAWDLWRGHRSLPELDLEDPEVVRELVSGEDSVVRAWVRRGADGLRLDCANDLGVAFCAEVARAARECRRDVLVVGETAHWGAAWLEALDGLQSYVPTQALLDLLMGRIGARQFGAVFSRLQAEAEEKLHRCWTMLSSHDVPRAATALGGDRRKLELALLLQFTLPGTPVVYYGDEVGMAGGADPANRAPMVWDETAWDLGLLDLHRRLAALRRAHPELARGAFTDLSGPLDNGVAAFLRTDPLDPRRFCVVAANPLREARTFRLFVPASRMFADMPMRDLLSGRTVTALPGALELELPPLAGAVYVPEFEQARYSFAKRL